MMMLNADDFRGKIVHTVASLAGSIGTLYLQVVIDSHTIWYRVRHNGRIKKKSLQPDVAIAFYNGVVARAKLKFPPIELSGDNVSLSVVHVLASHAGSIGTLHLEVATDWPNVLYRVRKSGTVRLKTIDLDRAVDFYNRTLEKGEKKARPIRLGNAMFSVQSMRTS
jgi:predicted transcriptional regulator